ncbi:MAG: hybrid sensor histidine kinase/response regulator, partial [Desulfobulbaceae bacterium]|nr:hybrid sensor histidine kinase/response regulator [Desulfobulbaceae bacterium]
MGHSGTGFGLTVVWSAVQEHQGFIEVKQPPVGSIFELYFPATAEQVDSEALLLANVEIKGKGEHILVIDDEENVRILAEK